MNNNNNYNNKRINTDHSYNIFTEREVTKCSSNDINAENRREWILQHLQHVLLRGVLHLCQKRHKLHLASGWETEEGKREECSLCKVECLELDIRKRCESFDRSVPITINYSQLQSSPLTPWEIFSGMGQCWHISIHWVRFSYTICMGSRSITQCFNVEQV